MSARTLEVVLIEDNSADVYLVGRALQEAGLDVNLRILKNGEEALRFLEDLRETFVPDLFLIDWNLPRVPGKVVLKAIHESQHTGSAPRIVLTSSQSPADKSEAEQMGAIFLSKPRSLDEFIEIGQKVRTLLGDH